MTQLLYVIGGWIGLVSRGSVVLQVLVAVALLLSYRVWRFRGRGSRRPWRAVLAKVVLAALFGLASLLLQPAEPLEGHLQTHQSSISRSSVVISHHQSSSAIHLPPSIIQHLSSIVIIIHSFIIHHPSPAIIQP
jgi:hypothetical protein